MLKMIISITSVLTAALIAAGCSSKTATAAAADAQDAENRDVPQTLSGSEVAFDADSAFSYVARQVEFGPRVPNTQAHGQCGEWLVSELQRHGAVVDVQKAGIKAFDGTVMNASNILGRYNPEASDRTLLVAHWDTRPWTDEDPDPANHTTPGDGANDGASGVGVLLEVARQLGAKAPANGVDILFVDAEDWGSSGDDDSWALGSEYFLKNPPVNGYSPSQVILLDMVGGKGAVFHREYFSEKSAPWLNDKVWSAAARLGYSSLFPNSMGGAVNDDHLRFHEQGIPAIDIIEYHPESGFNASWHTKADNMSGIDKSTLGAVGSVIMSVIGSGL